VLISVAGHQAAASLALAVWQSVPCDAVELAAGEADWTLAVRLRGSGAGVGEARERLEGICGAGVDAAPGIWGTLGAAEAAASMHLTLSAPPTRLASLLAAAAAFAAELEGPGDGFRIAAHGTAGIVRIWRDELVPAPAAEAFPDALRRLDADVASFGGTRRYDVMPEPLRQRITDGTLPARGDAAAAVIAERLRRTFDPAGIMMAGRGGVWE
jgi:FAD/FMN-containing dehydrogenase